MYHGIEAAGLISPKRSRHQRSNGDWALRLGEPVASIQRLRRAHQ